VGHVELARIGPFAAPPFDELAVPRKFHDTVVDEIEAVLLPGIM
jgi:hypothetical protein